MEFQQFCYEHCKNICANQVVEKMGSFITLIKKSAWAVSFMDRGMGHGDWGINVMLDDCDINIFKVCDSELAEYVVNLHNQSLKRKKNDSQQKRH